MLKPNGFTGKIPPEVRYCLNGRVYWSTYFGKGIWSIEPIDDAPALVYCSGDWRSAIAEFETR